MQDTFPAGATTPPRRRRRRLVAAGTSVILFAGAAVAAGVWWVNRESKFPDQWDPRVTDFVEFVEDERGLEFEHPVHIDFLTEKEFAKEVTSDEDELTDEDREEIEQASGLMRALGLLGSDVDLVQAMNDLGSGGILGLYDHEDKRIRLRGDELTPVVKSTLVHELTHALQDQHFDLQGTSERHEEEDDSGAAAGWAAVVEGDADRIEEEYAASLSAKEKKALERAESEDSEQADEDLSDVPPFLLTSISSSYAFGDVLLSLATELDGEDAIDELFEKPPTTEEHLLDPWTLLTDEQDASEVEEPELADGGKDFDAGTLGAPTWLFMLAERIAPLRALDAADGWAGDHYVAYELDDRSCLRVDYLGDTRNDVVEMRGALQQWIARGPKGTASVRAHGEGLRFTSCDPGKRARPGSGGSGEALELAVGRVYVALEMLPEGLPPAFARCYANGVVHEFTSAELSSADGQDPAFTRRLQQAAAPCQ